MPKDKRDIVILSLVLVIVFFFILLGYLFIISPAISAKATQQYNQGQIDLVNSMLTQIQQTGAVRIPLSNNQLLILVPYVPAQ
jgi:hypothetical protein